MFITVIAKAEYFLKQGHERTLKLKKNVLISLLIKGGSIIIGLLLVPMTIDYINPVQYGIWLTISSFLSWINFFDIGLGNGLRNKLAQSMALGKLEEAKTYVSTTYAVLFLISILLMGLTFLTVPYLNWNIILNLPDSFTDDITIVMFIVFASFSIQFVAQLINVVLTATHEPYKSSLIVLAGQFLVLVAIFIIKQILPGDLLTLVIILSCIPLLATFFFSVLWYKTSHQDIAPSLKFVNFTFIKSLLQLGGAFFFIQLGALILFQTDNIIITQLLGPEAVTVFNVAHKLFSLVLVVLNIIVTPFWSAFTDAYTKKDYQWIRSNIRKIRMMAAVLSGLAVLLCILSDQLYEIWLGNSLLIPDTVTISMTLYVVSLCWQSIHVYFLNGIGKIKLQLVLVLISSMLNVPLAIMLGKMYGLEGIIAANTVLFVMMGVAFYFQTNSLINENNAETGFSKMKKMG